MSTYDWVHSEIEIVVAKGDWGICLSILSSNDDHRLQDGCHSDSVGGVMRVQDVNQVASAVSLRQMVIRRTRKHVIILNEGGSCGVGVQYHCIDDDGFPNKQVNEAYISCTHGGESHANHMWVKKGSEGGGHTSHTGFPAL